MSEIWRPSMRLLHESACQLDITWRDSGTYKRWEPNEEQIAGWWHYQERDKPHRYILKNRQVGFSTSECLIDSLFGGGNARLGTPVHTFLLWDKEDNSLEKLRLIESFLAQLRIEAKKSGHVLFLPVKGRDVYGTISALTAGGKRAGASKTAHRIHMSENPNWERAGESFLSAMGTLVGDGDAVVETTMLLGQEHPITLWQKPNRAWKKIFFGVEDHAEYRRPASEFRENHADLPGSLLRDWGLTNVETMAFMQYVFEDKCGSDIIKLGREYPPTPEIALQSSKGRWVKITPRVVEHESERMLGGEYIARIFKRPEEIWRDPSDHGDRIVIGVDTAGCRPDTDRSTIAVVDRKDSSLVATFVSDIVPVDDLAKCLAHLAALYTAPSLIDPWSHKEVGQARPHVIIEVNGIGQVTSQDARKYGVSHVRYDAKAGSTYRMMQSAKRAIEAEAVYGCPELAQECDSVSYADNRFRGRKDLLVAVGIATRDLALHPWVPPLPPKQSDVWTPPPRGGRTRRSL